jgi:hypothetical protein
MARGQTALSKGEEDNMDHPPCPACQKGYLLPLSGANQAFFLWVCSAPQCAYVVSGSPTAATYYKGSAVQQEKAKGEKTWIEFSF